MPTGDAPRTNHWRGAVLRACGEVFEVETAVVVTQGTYAARAVDLGLAAGIDIQAYAIGDGGRWGRELLARVRGLGEAIWRPRGHRRPDNPDHR